LRRKRVERVVAYSARVGSSKTVGTVGRWLRDLVTPLALKLFASPSAHAWLYGYHIDWSERVISTGSGTRNVMASADSI